MPAAQFSSLVLALAIAAIQVVPVRVLWQMLRLF